MSKFTLQLQIQKELNQLNSNLNYYGSENQIENEIYISSTSKVEMLYNETIEEYYKRLLTI
tara:strand:- start:373 stop:555 length:183 start_codon:yes stop_codon:yes gene_type:complete